MNKQQVAIITAVIGAVGAAAGGSYALDFSNTETNIDSHDTTISGDTNIFNQWTEEIIDEATLSAICNQDVIPEEYTKTCAER